MLRVNQKLLYLVRIATWKHFCWRRWLWTLVLVNSLKKSEWNVTAPLTQKFHFLVRNKDTQSYEMCEDTHAVACLMLVEHLWLSGMTWMSFSREWRGCCSHIKWVVYDSATIRPGQWKPIWVDLKIIMNGKRKCRKTQTIILHKVKKQHSLRLYKIKIDSDIQN